MKCRCYQKIDPGYLIRQDGIIRPSCRVCAAVYSTDRIPDRESGDVTDSFNLRPDGRRWFEPKDGNETKIVYINEVLK